MSERFDILRPLLAQYNRCFSILDVGSGIDRGIAHEIATAFPNCTIVCAEKDELRYAPARNQIVLRRQLSLRDMIELAQSERFDLVLGLNILHWLGPDWSAWLIAMQAIGDRVVIQTPHATDTEACGGEWVPEIYWGVYKNQFLGESAQFDKHRKRPLFKVLGMPLYIRKKFVGADRDVVGKVSRNKDPAEIQLLHKPGGPVMPFIPGFTLENFLRLDGVSPDRAKLIRQVRALAGSDHRDIQAWNIRMTGPEMVLIDPGGRDWPDSDAENIAALVERINA